MFNIQNALRRSNELLAGCRVQGGGKAAFHMCSPIGWINDPNGFSWFDGQTHLFFQHYPYATHWGPMHWGHVTTEDFVRWTLLPEALAPDQAYESGCFSGSAVTIGGRHALVYTSHLDEKQPDGTIVPRQQQSIALGDGMHYEKHESNPVVRSEAIPPQGSTADFRDPKVWEENGVYRMVVGNRAADQCGQILLYESIDLIHWEFVTVVDCSGGQLGRMWECPDFFSLDDQQVLMISPQDMQAGEDFHGGNGTVAILGQWNENNKTFLRETLLPVDYGCDFYAPQTTMLPDGRRILIAWMKSWDNDMTPPDHNWSGMMTFPRELRIQGGRLYQLPVSELNAYRVKPCHMEGSIARESLKLMTGRQLDATLTLKNDVDFSLDVASDGQHYTRLTYQAQKKRILIDRSHAGMANDRFPTYTIPLHGAHTELRLRLLMDKYSLELFINDGSQAVTLLIYTPEQAQDVMLHAQQPLEYVFEGYEISVPDTGREGSSHDA